MPCHAHAGPRGSEARGWQGRRSGIGDRGYSGGRHSKFIDTLPLSPLHKKFLARPPEKSVPRQRWSLRVSNVAREFN